MKKANKNNDRTLQIVSGLTEVLEPGTRWEVDRGALNDIGGELVDFVEYRLSRLLYVAFTLRHDAPVLTQVSFVTHLADIIYQSWKGTHHQDGERRLHESVFARQYGGVNALCVALAIYAKMKGVSEGIIKEEEAENHVWNVRCAIASMEEWRQRMRNVPPLIPRGEESSTSP